MAPSFKTTAAILGFAGLAAAGYDPTSKNNVVVYWGQGPNQKNLVETCADPSIDIVNIGFINRFPDNSPGDYPGSNFGNQCPGTTYKNSDGEDTDLLSGCPFIPADIKTCQQKYKKTVMLSLGGAYPGNYYLENDATAARFAEFLWYAFGPENPEWMAAGMPRPFGDAVVDGFDLDIEGYLSSPPLDSAGVPINDYQSRGYAALVTTLRGYFLTDPLNKYYISGSPQCQVPDAHLAPAIRDASFDWLFVQFYNTAGCSARDGYNHLSNPASTDISFDQWSHVASANKNVRIILGVPAAPAGALAGFYLSQQEMNKLVASIYNKYSNFGGIGLWEATYSQTNTLCGQTYAFWMNKILESLSAGKTLGDSDFKCPASSSSSSAAPTTTIVTSTPKVTSTSSFSTSSAVPTTSSVTSTSKTETTSSVSTSSKAATTSSISTSSATPTTSSISTSSATPLTSSVSTSSSAKTTSSGTSSSAGVTTSPVSSSATGSASPSSMESSVSASCLSKPSNAHTKSRTKADHHIGWCTSGCNSASSMMETKTASESTHTTSSATETKTASESTHTGSSATETKSATTSNADVVSSTGFVTASCLSKPSNIHTKSRTKADHSIGHCTSDCSASAYETSGSSASHTSSVPVVTSIPVYESTSSAHESTLPAHSSSASSSTTCTDKKVSSTAVVSSVPPKYESSTAVVESSMPPYYYGSSSSETVVVTTSVPAKASSTSSAVVVVSSSMPVYSSSSVVVDSSVPPYYHASSSEIVLTSTVPAKASSTSSVAIVTSTMPGYQGSSSVVVESSVPYYHMESSSVAVVTSTVPYYHMESSSMAVETSTMPYYHMESSSMAVETSTMPYYHMESSSMAVETSTMPYYHVESSSVAIVTSTAPAHSTSTVVVPPGYEHESSKAASSAPTAPIYGASTTSVAASSSWMHEEHSQTWGQGYSATTTGAAAQSSWADEEYSQTWDKNNGYGAQTSVAAASSTVAMYKPSASASISTMYVIPVGPSSPVGSGTPTQSKPAMYTGAAFKPTVGMGMLTALFGAVLLLL